MRVTRGEMIQTLTDLHGVATGRGEFIVTGAPMGDFNALVRALACELRPRVMSLEDVIGGAGTPAYMEARSQRGYKGWVLIYDVQEGIGITGVRIGVTKPGHITIWPARELYGVKWRLWTDRPTDEEREGTPWNGQS